jgi:hypothetical protein
MLSRWVKPVGGQVSYWIPADEAQAPDDCNVLIERAQNSNLNTGRKSYVKGGKNGLIAGDYSDYPAMPIGNIRRNNN